MLAVLRQRLRRQGFRKQGTLALAGLLLAATPRVTWACAVCFGDPNSLQTKAVNASILALLAVIVTVLALFASLFGYWMYRHAKYNPLALNGVSD